MCVFTFSSETHYTDTHLKYPWCVYLQNTRLMGRRLVPSFWLNSDPVIIDIDCVFVLSLSPLEQEPETGSESEFLIESEGQKTIN